MKIYSLFLLTTGIIFSSFAQQVKDKGSFQKARPGYYQNTILKGVEDDEKKNASAQPPVVFKIDLSTIDRPKSVDEFKVSSWINKPVSQGNTGTCWSFSTTSFYESEIYRLTKQQVDLSEMYTVYWEYVEKARRYVQERGNSLVDEGSEANAVKRMMKEYGCVPFADYSGMKKGCTVYSHAKMAEEIKAYLASVKAMNAWNEAAVLSTVKAILENYMGVPPSKVKVNGKEYTPKEYMTNVLKFNPDDYVDVTSLMERPYWQQVEYAVPDNWWHDSSYYNVPLDDFMKVLKTAVRSGYTIFIGGDISEAGLDSYNNVAVVPTFDIPSEYIDENARQFRFSNKSTTDDHGMHLVGYMEKNGKDWYLVKDSGSGSRNVGEESKNFGYYFFHEDYVKLKMMDIVVHKEAFKEYLSKFKK